MTLTALRLQLRPQVRTLRVETCRCVLFEQMSSASVACNVRGAQRIEPTGHDGDLCVVLCDLRHRSNGKFLQSVHRQSHHESTALQHSRLPLFHSVFNPVKSLSRWLCYVSRMVMLCLRIRFQHMALNGLSGVTVPTGFCSSVEMWSSLLRKLRFEARFRFVFLSHSVILRHTH